MASDIKAGDVVHLKGHTVPMTVAEVRDSVGNPPEAICQWFSGTILHEGRFPLTSLVSAQ